MHCTDMLALLSRRYNMELFETRIVHSRFIESRIPLELAAAAAATAIQIIFFPAPFLRCTNIIVIWAIENCNPHLFHGGENGKKEWWIKNTIKSPSWQLHKKFLLNLFQFNWARCVCETAEIVNDENRAPNVHLNSSFFYYLLILLARHVQ